MENWDDVIFMAEDFNKYFATSEEIQKIRDIRRRARSRTGSVGGTTK